METDNKTVRKSVNEALERTGKEGFLKLACLKAVRQGFEVGRYLEVRAKSAIDISSVRSRTVKSVEDDSGVIKHPVLFTRLKEWRNTKAKETNLPHYMILPRKPWNPVNLYHNQWGSQQIKGMGKKQSENTGRLLGIMISYCTKEKYERR